jgi:hypothetical protein
MSLQKSGYTEKSSESFLIDAAVIYSNVAFSEADGFVGELLGATSGGVNLTIETAYRDREVDGTGHTRVKGLKALESAVGTATANVKELTAESIRKSLNGTIREAREDEAPSGYQVIESKRYVEGGDFLDNVAFVGVISGSTKPIIAILDNALCTTGLTIETEDNNEAVVEQTFEAHADTEQLQKDEFPWRIFYPNVEGTTEGTQGASGQTLNRKVAAPVKNTKEAEDKK